MIIDQDTKISKILEEFPQAVDVIAEINTHFNKLKNPILRKFLAPRVCVKDAAKIGGVSVQVFLEKLKEKGFTVAFPESDEVEVVAVAAFKVDTQHTTILDVRPVIQSGADPFSQIMAAVKALPNDRILEVINVFEPIPLIDVLKKKGFESWTQVVSKEEYHTFFKKTEEGNNKEIELLEEEPLHFDDFETKMADYGSNLVEIDVRHLEMPEPMVTILNALTTLPENHLLFVHHKKVPQFLLPELKSRNFTWMTKEIDENNVQMIIFK